jgi:hypothetical protein
VKKLKKEKTAPNIASQPSKKFKMRGMKKWNIQGVSSLMQGHMSRVELDTKMVTITTLG